MTTPRVPLLFCLFALCTWFVATAPAQDGTEDSAPDARSERRAFAWDVTVPPGGYAIARFDRATGTVSHTVTHTVASGPAYGPDDPRAAGALTDTARRAVAATPEWVRRDLLVKFADLRSERLGLPGATTIGTVGDVDRSLVLRNDATGEQLAWQLPSFVPRDASEITGLRATSHGLVATVTDEGAVRVEHVEPTDDQEAIELQLPIEAVAAAMADVDQDQRADVLVLDVAGCVRVLRNVGSATTPQFMVPRRDCLRALPETGPLPVVPRIVRVRDIIGLAVGTHDGTLQTWACRDGVWQLHKEREFEGVSNIAPGAVTNSWIIGGLRDGRIARFNVNLEVEPLFEGQTFGTYAAPASGDFDGDGTADLVIGTREGQVYLATGRTDADEPAFTTPVALPGLDLPSAVPVVLAPNRLLVGLRDGTLQEWVRDGETFARVDDAPVNGIDVGEYAAPCLGDLDGDGTHELVVGNSDGRLTAFAKVGDHYVEHQSWSFQAMGTVNTLDDYYARYFDELPALRAPSDHAAVDAFARELLDAKPEWRDEIAYVIATTPTEVLRTMHRLDQTDVVSRNARMVYAMDEIAKYARLTDADGVTTLELNTQRGWIAVPRDVYYRFVVHPRILFEIPARVDVSWWATSHTDRGMERDDWLRHDAGMLYGTSDAHQFWREALLTDEMKQRQLVDYVRDCETQEDAIFALSRYLSYSEPDSFMSFGYLTNDLQPLLIYAKGYGSCGETSTICTTICRLLLIPAYIVGCRGEDHQWSEVYDAGTGTFAVWNCNATAAGFGHIWGPGEGGNHRGKTISTIMAFGPDDQVWPTTTTAANPPGSGYMPDDKGYTPTARVTIRVVDAAGQPVDGALVVARSHWNRANMLSMLHHTDLDGRCEFHLGWEPHGGYTIDVLSTLGTAGTMNLPVVEGESYEVMYRLPGTRPDVAAVTVVEDAVGAAGVQLESVATTAHAQRQYPRSFFTGQRYRINSAIAELTGYTGTRWYPRDQRATCGQAVLMDAANVQRFRDGEPCTAFPLGADVPAGTEWFVVCDNRASLHTWQRYDVSFDVVSAAAPPTLELETAGIRAPMATTTGATIRGVARDASGIAAVELSVNGRDWSPVACHEGGRFQMDWNGRVGSQVLAPGAYSLRVRATDHAGHQTTETLPIEITPARTLAQQRIRQDNADNPLSATWVLGPFTIPADERSLSIVTRGHTSGMDVDVFLYADRNGNRRRDNNEQVATSTTPTSNERIFIDEPDTGCVYWLYVHGWQVPEAGGELDVILSFHASRVRVADVSPVGVQAATGPMTATVDGPADLEIIATVDDTPWLVDRDDSGHLTINPPVGTALADGVHTVRLRALENGESAFACEWTVTLDSVDPTGSVASLEYRDGVVHIVAEAVDGDAGADGVTKVTATLAGGSPVNLKRDRDNPTRWTGTAKRDHVAGGGDAECAITIHDRAGNTGTATGRISLPAIEVPPVEPVSAVEFFRIHPGTSTPDTRPTIQAYWRLADGVDAQAVHVTVTNADGTVVAERQQAASPFGYVAFRPVDVLAPGDYQMVVRLTVSGQDEPAVHTSTFRIAPMNWQDER